MKNMVILVPKIFRFLPPVVSTANNLCLVNLRTTSSADSVFTWSVSYKQTILVSSVMSALSITSLLSIFLVSDVVIIAEAEGGCPW